MVSAIEFDVLTTSYPIVAMSVNVLLMGIRNWVFEMRQREVSNSINNKYVEQLVVTRKNKKFYPATWSECQPGDIIRIKSD